MNDTYINFRITKKQKDALSKLAKKERRTLSNLMHKLVDDLLKGTK